MIEYGCRRWVWIQTCLYVRWRHGVKLGGLARATVDAVAILDAAGYDKVIVETVGVGQDEVEIVKAADVSVVVLVPGMGDDIQAIKAGHHGNR